MAVYTVHIPKSASPEKIAFVSDDFSWSAFLFGPFWLAWKKAWLAAGLWAMALALLGAAGAALGFSRSAISIAALAAGVVLGFEGARLLAWTLTRRGYAESAVAVGDNLEEAEEVFFNAWRPAAPAPVPAPPRASGDPNAQAAAPGEHVVGGLVEERRV